MNLPIKCELALDCIANRVINCESALVCIVNLDNQMNRKIDKGRAGAKTKLRSTYGAVRLAGQMKKMTTIWS